MCGIAGKLYFDPARPVSPAVIDAMTDRLVHRGPDARGVHIDGATGLGHRRLSIIDLSESANQPMTGPSGVVLTFNGEIYNFKALRSNLEAKGREFRTSSDTEVLLALYEDRGPACVHDLVGMFAFAIWDPRTRTLFCARDRIGQKPFYYSHRPDGFSFASELAALLEDDDVSAEVNATAIHHYLTLHYVPSPETAFEGVSKLPPAHTLTLRDGKLSTERYWRNSFEPKHAASVGELAVKQERPEVRMKSPLVLQQRNVVAMKRHDEGQLESLHIGQRVDRAGGEVGMDDVERLRSKAPIECGADARRRVGDVCAVDRLVWKPIEVLGAPTEDLRLVSHVVDELLVDEGLGVRQEVCIEDCRVPQRCHALVMKEPQPRAKRVGSDVGSQGEVDLLDVMCYMGRSSWHGSICLAGSLTVG